MEFENIVKPPSYNKQQHCLIKTDPACTVCELGKVRDRHNLEFVEADKAENIEQAVGGAGPEDLTQVKLIVISDFPGTYEARAGHPMVDIRESRAERKKGLLTPLNAGAQLRMALQLMYGLDTYNDCWVTNALKCNPGARKPIENKHVKPCVQQWLSAELTILDKYCPAAPILVAGGQAFKAVLLLYKQEAIELKSYGLNGCRRRKGLMLGRHPAVFTFNPAGAARSMPKIETEIASRNGKLVVKSNEWLYPPLPGSPTDKFIKDLHLLAPYLT